MGGRCGRFSRDGLYAVVPWCHALTHTINPRERCIIRLFLYIYPLSNVRPLKNEEKLHIGRPSKKRLHFPYFNIYIIIIYSSSVFFKLTQILLYKILNFVHKAA